jgi:mannose-6-phosphate isomerase-like protein (cupin superfamily)
VTTASIQSTCLRLRPDSSIETLPVDASFWPRLMSGQLGDFHHEYLVTSHTFSCDWPSWEIHPNGDEIVLLLSGRATMVLETRDGQHEHVELKVPGSFAFVPRETWHTAKIHGESVMLFITAGEGTRNRPA